MAKLPSHKASSEFLPWNNSLAIPPGEPPLYMKRQETASSQLDPFDLAIVGPRLLGDPLFWRLDAFLFHPFTETENEAEKTLDQLLLLNDERVVKMIGTLWRIKRDTTQFLGALKHRRELRDQALETKSTPDWIDELPLKKKQAYALYFLLEMNHITNPRSALAQQFLNTWDEYVSPPKNEEDLFARYFSMMGIEPNSPAAAFEIDLFMTYDHNWRPMLSVLMSARTINTIRTAEFIPCEGWYKDLPVAKADRKTNRIAKRKESIRKEIDRFAKQAGFRQLSNFSSKKRATRRRRRSALEKYAAELPMPIFGHSDHTDV